ncbi:MULTISPECIES: M15 family metallopeptidase [unclassified Lactococcus]|uniref:M15 family metallopeptidase n=1 Tax=unclassified Lactococcus TaxID=2643510 RepID=UPI0011CA0541|nr:D-alanyl-D-alanine carboxypeptidase family protein [Lactococcus sp. dk101]TXK45195.1 D-alanyl-D-alanine carboxypeptidase family protein [Lactococcus sp. dk310]TXK51027.1 D-alanyl-D-alanine carboxypeptidase family protein [Lactococcus sp. dk322]
MEKNKKTYVIIGLLVVILVAIVTVGLNRSDQVLKAETLENVASSQQNATSTQDKSSTSSTQQTNKNKTTAIASLPNAKQSDWNLIVVNRNQPKAEINPPLTTVDGKQVDSRIATAVQNFLVAAQKIAPAEHLISGYRSVAYQSQLYQLYLSQELAGNGTVNQTGKSISQAQAVANVNSYSQPAGSSEHDTGLAIDMSTVNSLNAADPTVAAKVASLAPQYGFVLRFEKGKEASTGVNYEDWHYRYVGVENAKYMVAHHLSLEEYVALLPK